MTHAQELPPACVVQPLIGCVSRRACVREGIATVTTAGAQATGVWAGGTGKPTLGVMGPATKESFGFVRKHPGSQRGCARTAKVVDPLQPRPHDLRSEQWRRREHQGVAYTEGAWRSEEAQAMYGHGLACAVQRGQFMV